MGVYVIEDFTKGKRTRRGEPLADASAPFAVTVVTRDAADGFFGTRNGRERMQHLRALRDLGLLVHDHGRLTQRVRLGDGGKVRCYVVKGETRSVPVARRSRAARVPFW